MACKLHAVRERAATLPMGREDSAACACAEAAEPTPYI